MTNDRANLVNTKPLGDEVTDGLAATVVKVEVVDRGAILDGGIPSAAKENVERRPCDCEYIAGWHPDYFCILRKVNKPLPKYRYCRYRQRDGP